jgi:hypothetical protein
MAVNLHLSAWHRADDDDTWGREFIGWRDDLTDQELWGLNRGIWSIGPKAELEAYATLSCEGEIKVVARLTGPREPILHRGQHWHALVGDVLPAGDPVREALVGRRVVGRHVSYPDTSDVEGDGDRRIRNAFLLTHNPGEWDWDPADFATALAATRAGGVYADRWSIGGRAGGVGRGDRAFLLRLGSHGRGIVGSGTITGAIFTAEHWDESGRPSKYVLVDWDTILEPDDRLDVGELELAFPQQHWHPQGSGTQVHGDVLAELEALWADHLDGLGMHRGGGGGSGQGWQNNPLVRKAVEDAAQTRLEQHYRDLGWQVRDVRHDGLGYDARATKDSEEIYL